MDALNQQASADARTNSGIARTVSHGIMQRLAKLKNETVASAIGRDPTYISRIASGELGIKLGDLGAFLDAIGMKCVDKKQVCVDREVFLAYKTLSAKALSDPQTLEWDDE